MFVLGNNSNQNLRCFIASTSVISFYVDAKKILKLRAKGWRGVQQEQVRLGHFVGNPKNDARNCVISGWSKFRYGPYPPILTTLCRVKSGKFTNLCFWTKSLSLFFLSSRMFFWFQSKLISWSKEIGKSPFFISRFSHICFWYHAYLCLHYKHPLTTSCKYDVIYGLPLIASIKYWKKIYISCSITF